MTKWIVLPVLLCVALLPRSSLDAAAETRPLVGLTTDQPKCYDSAKGLYSVNVMWEPVVLNNEQVSYVVQSKYCAKRGVILCREACVAPLSSCSDAEHPNSVSVTAVGNKGHNYAAEYEFEPPEPRCLKPKAK